MLTPTKEKLQNIVVAAARLVREAGETSGLADEYVLQTVPSAIMELERRLNPRRIPFGGNGRKALGVAGWPDNGRVMRGLQLISDALDELLVHWHMEHVCEGCTYKAMLTTKGNTRVIQILNEVGEVEVEREYPFSPELLQEPVGKIARAVGWLADEIAQVDSGRAPKPPLSELEHEVLDLIAERTTEDANGNIIGGITGKEICNELCKRGRELNQSTLTRHVIPPLKKYHGVKNRRGVGYYIDQS